MILTVRRAEGARLLNRTWRVIRRVSDLTDDRGGQLEKALRQVGEPGGSNLTIQGDPSLFPSLPGLLYKQQATQKTITDI